MEGEWWRDSWRSITLVKFWVKKWDKVRHQGVRVDSGSEAKGLGTTVLSPGEQLSGSKDRWSCSGFYLCMGLCYENSPQSITDNENRFY